MAFLVGGGGGIALADSQGVDVDVDGQNVTPVIGVLALEESSETTPQTTLAPQTEYAITIPVTDDNSLRDVETVAVTIYFDNEVGTEAAPGTGNVNDAAIFTWTAHDTWASGAWALTSPASTTWTLVTEGSPTTRFPGTETDLSGDFVLHFKPGKVAREAAQADETEWRVYVKVTDDSAAFDEEAATPISPFSVSWYGDISTSVTSDVDFGNVTPGSTTDQALVNVNGEAGTSYSVTNIANGTFKLQVHAGDFTGASTSQVLTLDSDGTVNEGNIGLKTDDDADAVGADWITSGATTLTDHAAETGPTVEAGATPESVGMWLTLPKGARPDTYDGTVTWTLLAD
jgi:hypothetical protein